MKQLQDLDYRVSHRIARLLPLDSPFRKFFQIATISGTAFFWIIALPIWYFFLNGDKEAISLAFTTAIMLIPVFIAKQTIRRPRPDFKDTRFGAVVFDEWSFPSGHATRSTYVLILMSYYMPELALFWIVWALLMISTRLILGVHYVSDIIAGIILSSVSIFFMIWIDWLPIIPWDI